MMKKVRGLKLKVLFNASVILSGLRSSKGGSGTLLTLLKKSKIEGRISEIILDEVLRHSKKLGVSRPKAARLCLLLFKKIAQSPSPKIVDKYGKIVLDEGDAHMLASCEESAVKYLVTLDKKHLLVLKSKIKFVKIVTPGELLAIICGI